RNFVLKSGFDEREAPARPTLLGLEQKTWLIDGLTESDATWKFLGSDVQLAQMAIDLSRFEQLPEQFRNRFYFSTDQWDGYRSERAEILEAVADVDNVIALAGDIHAFYASELFVDFDAPTRPAAIEFVVAGITSTSVQEETQSTVDATPTLTALGLGELVPLFDEILVEGSPHYRYAKSSATGIAIIGVDRGRAVEVDFIHVDDVEKPKWNGRSEHVRFRVESGEKRIQRVRTALKRT